MKNYDWHSKKKKKKKKKKEKKEERKDSVKARFVAKSALVTL